MRNEFKPARFGPHDFNKGRNWFYVNQGSVDVCDGQSTMRISRVTLYDMIYRMEAESEKRAATKARDAKRAAATVGAQRKKGKPVSHD